MSLIKRKEISEEEAAQVLLDRRLARKNFAQFCRTLTPEEPPAEHHVLLCNALDEVASGLNDRLMVFMPPGSAKSTYSSKKFPSYYLGRFPTKSIICGSYGEGLSTTFGKAVRNIVLSNEYKVLFNARLSEDSRAKGEWETREGGSYYAVGVGSGVTGRRSDLNLIDDPVKGRKDADSELVRNEIWNWYLADFLTRLKPGGAQIIIQCMTGDTLVTMGGGSQKELRNIKVGDEVATYDNGEITTSKVLNWKNQGLDSVYKIKMKSGIIVRANERHPFLVERKGRLEWIRLKNLNVKDSVLRVIGGSGREPNVPSMGAKKKYPAKGYVRRTTIKNDGLMVFARRLLSKILRHVLVRNSSIVMASHLTTIPNYCESKTASVQFVKNPQKRQETLVIGTQSFVSTIAMKLEKLGGFCVTTVISLLGAARHQRFSNRQQNTSDFILDEIVSIEPDGCEDVFDIQVERTENFIANGLVSHNTRWHEDDLSGRILPDDWNFESGTFIGFDNQPWKVICIPAQAEKNDILGREEGEFLWTDYMTNEFWEVTKATQTSKDVRNWSALYQQRPQPDSGVFFKREWFEPHMYDLGDHPETTDYGASDYAVSDGKGDFTEQGVGGFDKDFDLWFKDWWSGQTTAEVWIEEQLRLAKKHKIYHWLAEVGVIRRSVEPFLNKRKKEKMRSGGQFFTMHWLNHIGDKAANARAFQALSSEGKVHIPRCEWGYALIDQLVKFIPNTNFKDDKVDVCGLFGRILDQAFAPTEIKPEPIIQRDSYGLDEDTKTNWKIM